MPRRDLSSLIERARAATADAALARRATALVDLTSLRGDEAAAEIEALCARAEDYGRRPSASTPPTPSPPARRWPAALRLAVVANFPHGSEDIAAARPRSGPRSPPERRRSTLWPRSAPSWRAMSAWLARWSRPPAPRPARHHAQGDPRDRHAGRARADHRRRARRRHGRRRLPQDLDRQGPGRRHARGRRPAARGHQEAGGRVGFKAAGGIRTACRRGGLPPLADELMGRAGRRRHLPFRRLRPAR